MQSYVEGFCDIPNIDEIIYPEHEQEKPSKDRSKLGGFGCTREKGPIKTSILLWSSCRFPSHLKAQLALGPHKGHQCFIRLSPSPTSPS